MSTPPSETCEWADHQVAKSLNLTERLFKRLETSRRHEHDERQAIHVRCDSTVRLVCDSKLGHSRVHSIVPTQQLKTGVWSSWLTKPDPEQESEKQKKMDVARSHRAATRSELETPPTAQSTRTATSQSTRTSPFSPVAQTSSFTAITVRSKVSMINLQMASESADGSNTIESPDLKSPLSRVQPTENTSSLCDSCIAVGQNYGNQLATSKKGEEVEQTGAMSQLVSDLSGMCSSCIFADQLKQVVQLEMQPISQHQLPASTSPDSSVWTGGLRDDQRQTPEFDFADTSERCSSVSHTSSSRVETEEVSSVDYDQELCESCKSELKKSATSCQTSGIPDTEKPNKITVISLPPIETMADSRGIEMNVGFVLNFANGRQKFVRVKCEMPDFEAERVRVVSEEAGSQAEYLEFRR